MRGFFYWVDTTITPYMGLDEKPQEYISIRTDITERKFAEIKLRQALSFDVYLNSDRQVCF